MLQILKARKSAERLRLERLLRRQTRRVQRAFNEFLRSVRSDEVMREVRRHLRANDIEEALRVADAYIIRFGDVVPRVFRDVGEQETEHLRRMIRRNLGPSSANIAIGFDVTHPRAAGLMRQNRLEFIRQFTRAQREVTRDALVEAMRGGFGPIRTSRIFRDSIGLTSTQRQHVENYRTALETGRRDALERTLRDRRFDPTVANAVEAGSPLSRSQINRMVDRYRQRYTAMRAENIARTESQRTLNQARQEALEQVTEQAEIPPDKVVRIWAATLDDRTRDTHWSMDGDEAGMEEPFISPSGARLMYPGDPLAPPEETINCRCVIETRILGEKDEGQGQLEGEQQTPRVSVNVEGSKTTIDRVERALVNVPDSHRRRFKGTIRTTDSSIATGPVGGGQAIGMYHQGNITVANWAKDFDATLVHEFGHAVDAATRFGESWRTPSVVLGRIMRSDSAAMSVKEASRAAYWLGDRKETFAELYSLAYGSLSSSAKYFGGLSRSKASKIFANSLTALKELDI